MSEIIDELTMLETRLGEEQISALMAIANQPQGGAFTQGELSRIANLHTALLAVRSEIAARQPREGWSNPACNFGVRVITVGGDVRFGIS